MSLINAASAGIGMCEQCDRVEYLYLVIDSKDKTWADGRLMCDECFGKARQA